MFGVPRYEPYKTEDFAEKIKNDFVSYVMQVNRTRPIDPLQPSNSLINGLSHNFLADFLRKSIMLIDDKSDAISLLTNISYYQALQITLLIEASFMGSSQPTELTGHIITFLSNTQEGASEQQIALANDLVKTARENTFAKYKQNDTEAQIAKNFNTIAGSNEKHYFTLLKNDINQLLKGKESILAATINRFCKILRIPFADWENIEFGTALNELTNDERQAIFGESFEQDKYEQFRDACYKAIKNWQDERKSSKDITDTADSRISLSDFLIVELRNLVVDRNGE